MTTLTKRLANLAEQFHSLNERHPSQWPLAPTMALFGMIIAVILFLGWRFYWTEELAELEKSRQTEAKLKQDYQQKIQKAISLDVLKQQKKLVSDYVAALEKQLPNKSEMEALLSDINQAGVGRGLQFELFKPGRDIARDYYIELPITIRVTGKYHDIAHFASDLAALPRIVSLQDINISVLAKNNDTSEYRRDTRRRNNDKEKNKTLTLDAVIKTYRYMESEEQQPPMPPASSSASSSTTLVSRLSPAATVATSQSRPASGARS